MPNKTELASLLQETEHIIHWSIVNVPEERIQEPPPHGKHPQSDKGFKTYFGDWSALRLLFHLAFYEEYYAIPAMQYCIGGPEPSADLVFPESEIEDQAWQYALDNHVTLSHLLQKFHQLRDIQLQLLRGAPAEAWHTETIFTDFGPVSLEFIVSKTIQHSLDHGNTILKNYLYWDEALDWLDKQADI